MRCNNCRDKFEVKRFGDKYCQKENCKKVKFEYQNKKISESTFGKQRGITITNDSKKKKPIRKMSKKLSKQTTVYNKVRKIYLEQNPFCECGCGSLATEIHHKNGRENERLVNVDFFMAVARFCHTEIHLNPKNSRELGYLI